MSARSPFHGDSTRGLHEGLGSCGLSCGGGSLKEPTKAPSLMLVEGHRLTGGQIHGAKSLRNDPYCQKPPRTLKSLAEGLCPHRVGTEGVGRDVPERPPILHFLSLFQLSSVTRVQGQEGLVSAWALAPRAVTASSQQPWTSKPKAAVAASSRIPCLRAQAAAVQPGRPRGEGLAVTLGSVSRKPQGPAVPPAPALSRPGGASSVAAIPVPSPSPVVLHAVHAVK